MATVTDHGAGHLLKLNPPELPPLVENEAFFIEAARRTGLAAVEARVVTDAEGATGLLVRRFDRRSGRDGRQLALAVEDGCQVLGQVSFAYLTGNGDAHAKNLAIVHQPPGEWRVSPAFDLPSSYLYGDRTIARADIPRRAFVELGQQLSLPEPAIGSMLDDLCDRAESWLPDLDSLPFPAGQLRKLRRTIEYRRRLLRGLAD